MRALVVAVLVAALRASDAAAPVTATIALTLPTLNATYDGSYAVRAGTPLFAQLVVTNGTLPAGVACYFCTRRGGQDGGSTCLDSLAAVSPCTALHTTTASASPLSGLYYEIFATPAGSGGPWTSPVFSTSANSPLAGQYCAAAYNIYIGTFVVAVVTALIGLVAFPLVSCYPLARCTRAGAVAKSNTARVIAYKAAASGAAVAHVHTPLQTVSGGSSMRALPAAIESTLEEYVYTHPLLEAESAWARFVAHLSLAPKTILNTESASILIVAGVAGAICNCIIVFINGGLSDPFTIACITQQGAAASGLIAVLTGILSALFKTALAGLGVSPAPMASQQ